MKPATNTLGEIFNADVRYVVPLYQRPYVWTMDRHWEPLWEDITVVLDHYLDGSGEPVRHFLGAIVLDQQDTPPGEPVRRLVIDGQQRLTTLQILMAAAARVAGADGCDRQARLLTKLTENDPDLATGEERFKVWPTNANQSAFRVVMQSGGPPVGAVDDPANTIHEAYAYFRRVITEWVQSGEQDAEQVAERHEALRVVLSGLLQVVSINLEPGDNAQVIFETLNARGTPLLALDLVKNAVFYRGERAGADVDHLNSSVWEPELGRKYWRETVRQGRLNRPRVELFLMHWLAMKLARVVSATELFTEFRTHILDTPIPPNITPLIEELCSDAAVMRGFDDQPVGSAEQRFFRHLDALDTTTVLPVALLLYRSPELTVEQRRLGIAALESWLVRRMICGYNAQNYNRLTGELLKLLAADVPHADVVIVEFLRSSDASSAVWPRDEKVIECLTQRRLYGWVSQKRIVMVLSALELAMRQSNKVEDIYSLPANLTVEHIMPQTWEEHWSSATDVDPDLREQHIHLLGNLTLTSGPLNSSLSNAAWPSKRIALTNNSLLMLNRAITSSETWNESLIDQRGRQLAQTICKLWPGPDSADWPVSSTEERWTEVPPPVAPSIQGAASQGGGSSDEPLRKRFWKELLDRARQHSPQFARVSPVDQTWVGTGAGITGLNFNYTATQHGTTVELYIGRPVASENDAIFDALREHRDSIEQEYGGSLSWEPLNDRIGCRIAARFDGGGYMDREEWATLQTRMIDGMIRLEQALRPHLAQIKARPIASA